MMESQQNTQGLVLVLGATGKTGRRIVESLQHKGVPTRAGSRRAAPGFDWDHEEGWDDCLKGVESVYINYSPDLAMPGATDAIREFVSKAKRVD
jgi:uncharacterized protein YbjT (DUF2867 family)